MSNNEDRGPRKVAVLNEQSPIWSFDSKGTKIKVGDIATRKYEGEDVFRYDWKNIAETDYTQLKPTKTLWSPLQPILALEPLFDEGWELQRTTIGKGGKHTTALLTHPDGQTFKDPFRYDAGQWSGDSGKEDGLTEMLFAKVQVEPGKGATYTRGFYRYICMNGLVDMALRLGYVSMNSTNFDRDELLEKLLGTPLSDKAILGERIGSEIGLNRFSNFLDKFQIEGLDTEWYSSLPSIARKLVTPFDKLPVWVMDYLPDQVKALKGTGRKTIHRGHVINMITSAVNLGMQENETNNRFTAEGRVQAAVNATADLVGLYSM